ncbi:MFS transporter [Actinoplanes sp. CA-142083]|uniref:MFS transporter n=1 Tax=Actinoplanes sp. CA-142083 TaxID=3239903 RepID=UPI003D8EFADE
MPRPAAAGSYRAVLQLPSASRTFVPALGGRLAYGLLPLATLFTIQQATGSYAAAGLALALFGLASITLPLKARYLRLLPWMALLCALFLGAAALTPWPVVFVGLAGLAAPPLGPAMRATWRSLTEGSSLKERAYALDSIAEETLYLVGPVLAGLLIAVAPARWALLLTAGLLLIGTVGMVLAAPALRAAPLSTAPAAPAPAPAAPAPAAPAPAAPAPAAPAPAVPAPALASVPVAPASAGVAESDVAVPDVGRRLLRLLDPGPLRSRGLLGVLAVLLLTGAGISVAYTGMAAVAQSHGRPGAAGLLEGAVGVGSVVGGLLWSRRRHSRARSQHFAGLLALLAAGLLTATVAPGLVALGSVMAVAGLALAPLYVVAYLAADDLTPTGQSTEAGTWINVAANAGSALGAATAGLVTDQLGPSPAFLLAGLTVAGASLAALLAGRGAARLVSDPAGPRLIGCSENQR